MVRFGLLSLWALALNGIITPFAHAEIETVTVRWTEALCDKGCADLVATHLRKLQGADVVKVNQSSGTADIQWKKDRPFNFYDINMAMRTVGPRIKDVRMKVKGTVVQDGKSFILISSGDNTRFILLGPIQASTRQYSVQYNPVAHPLTPQMQSLLIDAQKQKTIVTIDGPLFEPFRAPPMYLILENLTTPDKQ